jgi:hypothetical protein
VLWAVATVAASQAGTMQSHRPARAVVPLPVSSEGLFGYRPLSERFGIAGIGAFEEIALSGELPRQY